MKKSSTAEINYKSIAPLCRKLYNKYKKQNKIPEAKIEIPKSGTTSLWPNIDDHSQPVGVPDFSRNCFKDKDQYWGICFRGTSGVVKEGLVESINKLTYGDEIDSFIKDPLKN